MVNHTTTKTAAEIQHAVSLARSGVLGGRGPGASPSEVFRHGRGKLVQAGLPAVRRLAVTAREASQARGEHRFVDGGLVPACGAVDGEGEGEEQKNAPRQVPTLLDIGCFLARGCSPRDGWCTRLPMARYLLDPGASR